ncbi:visual pigment-like receptor peropsin [Pholidichthys leucotaenia]
MGLDPEVNVSDGAEPYGGKSSFTQLEHNIVAAYLITAGVISLVSNIVVLLMFVKYRELRTATNSIIINLAFTDIGVAGIGYPMSAASDIHGSWKFGYNGCQMSIVMIAMFLVAWSPYSMVCLWASFGDPRTIPAPMAIIAPLFAKSSTFYNPCIYVVANKKFRRAIIGMIRCQTRQRITINTQLPMTTSQQPLTQ